MGKRTYQALQNRRDEKYLEGRVMGVGGNKAYGGTRGSFTSLSHEEQPGGDLPLASADWEEYHKPSPANEPSWRGFFEFALGIIGVILLSLALFFPYTWPLVFLGAVCFAILMASAALRRGKLSSH
jgi:hypothetical protein